MAEEPFWPGAKYSWASRISVRCKWRISMAMRSTELAMRPRSRRRRRGVARDHLGGVGFRHQAQLVGDVRLDRGIDVGVGADHARDGAGGNLAAGDDEALAVAGELGVEAGQLEAEGHRLGVDAVAAAHAGGQLVFEGALFERRQQLVEVGQEDVGGLRELYGERCPAVGRSCPGARSATARRRARHSVKNALTSCGFRLVASMRSMRSA
jgi:hypothetical protein